MCEYGKYLIDCFENNRYKCTISAVFETRKLAEKYIELYLNGKKNCSFVVHYTEYYY